MTKYRAVRDGTLANPFRWVRKGQSVDRSEIDLTDEALAKSSWLLPVDDADKKLNSKPLPITPYLTDQGKHTKPRDATFVPPVPASAGYNQQMAEVIKNEKLQDEAAKLLKQGGSTQIQHPQTPQAATTGTAPAEPAGPAPATEQTGGTANQDVL